jgi:ribonuclease HII
VAAYSIPPDLQARLDATEYICGSDECGYGSWAGPLSVCAVVAPKTWTLAGVTDSKKLTRVARERVYPELIKAVTYCLVHIEPREFDGLGASRAFVEAHTRAITGALDEHRTKGHEAPPLAIIDGVRGVAGALPLPKADQLIPAVSAASIIAKVTHDWRMDELDKLYPGYGLSKNAGYGTPIHQTALRLLGVSAAHRRSYQPMQGMLAIRVDDQFPVSSE